MRLNAGSFGLHNLHPSHFKPVRRDGGIEGHGVRFKGGDANAAAHELQRLPTVAM